MSLVYLAGPMIGHSFDEMTEWRDSAITHLANYGIGCLSPLKGEAWSPEELEAHACLPETSNDRAHHVLHKDAFHVRRSDVVIANVLGAYDRISIGTCVELGWAYILNKPAILIAEPDNPHHHPMIGEPFTFELLDDALNLAVNLLVPGA